MISANFKTNILALAIFTLIALAGCLPQDSIIELPEYRPGETKVNFMDESIYSHVAYFDLSADTFVSVHPKILWDLSFENSPNGWHVILNSSKRMYAANTGTKDFAAYTNLSGSEVWRWDNSGGYLDSTALVNWVKISATDTLSHDSVYVLNLGVDEEGIQQGYKKIQFLGIKNGVYSFRFGDVADNSGTVYHLAKDGNSAYRMFSLAASGAELNIEPPKKSWDLLFAQYTTILYTNEGDPVPYFVQGVSINRTGGVEVAIDTSLKFNAVKIENVSALDFTDRKDIIGHEWKTVKVNIETMQAVYTVDTTKVFIVKDVDGWYYKFRFLSYVNQLNEKGFTTFEFQRL